MSEGRSRTFPMLIVRPRISKCGNHFIARASTWLRAALSYTIEAETLKMRTAICKTLDACVLGRWAHEFEERQSGDVRVLSLSGTQSVSPHHVGKF